MRSKDTATFFAKQSLSWPAQIALAKTSWTPDEKKAYDTALKVCRENEAAPLVTLRLCEILHRVFTDRNDDLNASRAAAYIKSYSWLVIPPITDEGQTSTINAALTL